MNEWMDEIQGYMRQKTSAGTSEESVCMSLIRIRSTAIKVMLLVHELLTRMA